MPSNFAIRYSDVQVQQILKVANNEVEKTVNDLKTAVYHDDDVSLFLNVFSLFEKAERVEAKAIGKFFMVMILV